MKVRIVVQIGLDGRNEADCFKLLSGTETTDLVQEVMQKPPPLRLKRTYLMADGMPHLLEYEGSEVW